LEKASALVIQAAGAAFVARATVLTPVEVAAALVGGNLGPRQDLLRQYQLLMGQALFLLRQK